MNSVGSSTAELAGGPFQDLWDWVIVCAIFIGIGALVFAALRTPLFTHWIGIGLISTFYMLYFLKSERSWEFVYGVLYAYFSFFTLLWIFPYAALTVRARSWLTR